MDVLDVLEYGDASFYGNDTDDEDEDFVHVLFDVVFPRRLRIFHVRNDPFMKYRDQEFLNRFRFTKKTVQFIIRLIENDIKSQSTR